MKVQWELIRTRGNANLERDFIEKEGIIDIPVGMDATTISVGIIDDNIYEEDENFYIRLVAVEDATVIVSGQIAEGIIKNDDKEPIISISNSIGNINEGEEFTINVELANAAYRRVRVNWELEGVRQ